MRCEDVTIDKLTITNPFDSPNTDGIDPESCRNVRITGCHIDVGDDCIAVKAGTEDALENVPCEKHRHHRLHDGARPRRRCAGERDERRHPPRVHRRMRV
ncbi:MAG: glycosyl hydrolase family 28 protein [Christensenellales bacterium]